MKEIIISENGKAPTETEKTELPKIEFYSIQFDKNGYIKGFSINLVAFTDAIFELGFCRFDLESGVCLFVRVENKVVEQVQIISIIDSVVHKVKHSQGCEHVDSKMIIEKLYGNLARYFSPMLLQRIQSEIPFDFVKDTKEKAFVCFKNGVVVCTEKGYELKPFSDFDKHLWKKQIIDREFTTLSDTLVLLEDKKKAKEIEVPFITEYGNFARFVYLLAGDEERFYSLCSLLGYIMHDFTDYKMRSVVLTDSVISEDSESNGRSGKTLLFRALKYIRKQTEINGKDFNHTDKHKYGTATIETQILFINDLQRKFDVEILFNDITEGITIDVKNAQPYTIPVKMLLTCNQPLKIEGNSAKDRFIEFDIKDYFSIDRSPEDEFKQWFFRDWDGTEWNKFDNFMLFCISHFLKNGIIEPSYLNLETRKLIEYTSQEFVIFFDELVKSGELKEKQEKTALYNKLINAYSDFHWLKQRTFTQWVRRYMQSSTLYKEHFKPYTKQANESRSNGNDYFEFFPLIEQDPKETPF